MSRVRYQEMIDVLFRNVSLTKKEKILDIGCAQGGFLNELSNLGFSDLYGVDVSKKFIEQAHKNLKSAKFVVGEATSLPFSDSLFDVVIIDQVLEHLLEPQLAIFEIERVLKVDGYLLVGVPNTEYYEKFSFFSYYWFLMKEHIQHFGINAIFNLVTNRDFDYINHDTRISHMNSYTQPFPNLITLFKKTNRADANESTSLPSSPKQLEIDSYLFQNRKLHMELNERIKRDVKSDQEIYVWGLGREFFFLMSQTPLKNYALKGLIDSNIQSFETKHFRGIQIAQPATLKWSTPNALVIIAATAHTENIKQELEMIGFEGHILEL
jgi:ubiquinone/menaquinone biosynthesis C-methylase UbiE